MPKNIYFRILIFVLILFTFTSVIVYSELYEDQINLQFEKEIVNELNQIYLKTPPNIEFIASLETKNGIVNNFNLIGYKNLDNNKILLLNILDFNKITIHSHPEELICIPSFKDRLVLSEKICLICGINRISCFSN